MTHGMRCSKCNSQDLRESDNFLKCHDCGQLHETELSRVSKHHVTKPFGYVLGITYFFIIILCLFVFSNPSLPIYVASAMYMLLYFAFGQSQVLQSDKKPADWGYNILVGALFSLLTASIFTALTLLSFHLVIELLLGAGLAVVTFLAVMGLGQYIELEVYLRS